jgi:nucleoredoxin
MLLLATMLIAAMESNGAFDIHGIKNIEEIKRRAEDFARVRDCIFDGANLRDQHGKKVTCGMLSGKTVALYFAGEWCPLCRRFTPALKKFYKEHGDNVEIIFISSDDSREEAENHYRHQTSSASTSWLALAYDDPLTETLKRKHRVWSGREVETFGRQRRAGVPSIVVIGSEGNEQNFIQGERFGAAALHEWEPEAADKWRLKEEI